MGRIFIEPQKNKDKYTCAHCNTISQMEVASHKFNSDIQGGGMSAHFENIVTIHRCQCCGKKMLWVDDLYIYPDLIQEEPNLDMPQSVLQLYKEAAMVSSRSPRAACALLRLAVDRLCNELGEKDRDINKNIAALVKRGLPQTVQQALDLVRVVGNKAVHPGVIEYDVDDYATAAMLMHLLNIIVTRMISEPKEIDELYQKLPKSVKDSVEKRDV